jgi:hypothetical protein
MPSQNARAKLAWNVSEKYKSKVLEELSRRPVESPLCDLDHTPGRPTRPKLVSFRV